MKTAKAKTSPPDEPLDGRFDERFNRAVKAIAVLDALARTTATGDNTHGVENDLWWGIADLTERVRADLEEMNDLFTRAANQLHERKAGAR